MPPRWIKNAHKLLGQSDIRNVKFFHAIAKELPFADDQFDLIYSRRGPISFLCESRILQHGGIVIGIHSGAKEEVTKRLAENHFTAIHMEEFEAYEHFPTKQDFARFYSRIPGNPDYLAPENSSLLEELIEAHTTAEGLVFRQWRYIWQAIKK